MGFLLFMVRTSGREGGKTALRSPDPATILARMIIDIHTHITYGKFPQFGAAFGRRPFTARTLLKRMDMEGIDASVVLPLANPENMDLFAVTGNLETIETCRRHPGRLIPFCNVDPRQGLNRPDADLSKILGVYKELGCRGIGEVCANLPITDARCRNLFRHAGEAGLPVLMHVASREGGLYGVIDGLHLPGLEQALRDFPKTIFIGHAPAFWCEIDGGVTPEQRESYPKGPVRPGGALWRLMDAHANLYGDLSAGSAHNALNRDPEAGCRFLQRYHRRLFFGTDRFTSATEPIPPIIGLIKGALRDRRITRAAYEDIMHRNFVRVFGTP